MLLFLKTTKSVRKFCQQLQPECTKLIKTGIFQELGSLGSYPLHFGIIEGLVTSLCQASWQSQIIQILHAAGDQPGTASSESLANQCE